MDGWNTIVSFWGPAHFRGQTVSFRECSPAKLGITPKVRRGNSVISQAKNSLGGVSIENTTLSDAASVFVHCMSDRYGWLQFLSTVSTFCLKYHETKSYSQVILSFLRLLVLPVMKDIESPHIQKRKNAQRHFVHF